MRISILDPFTKSFKDAQRNRNGLGNMFAIAEDTSIEIKLHFVLSSRFICFEESLTCYS